MNLGVGAVYQHRETGKLYVVVEHRPVGHPCNGIGLDSAIMLPISDVDLATFEPEPWAHIFDVTILCPEQQAHGAERWEEITGSYAFVSDPARRDRYEENRARDKGPTL